MQMLRKMRFTLATVMMLVVMSAAVSALFVKVQRIPKLANQTYLNLKVDAPILFVVSIVTTAVALASLKCHSAVQTMLQVTVACLGYLSLIWLAETGLTRPLLYWFQVSFAILVTLPLLARRIVKTEMERGPRRTWWMRTFEAIFFSYLTMTLILVGMLLQALALAVGVMFLV